MSNKKFFTILILLLLAGGVIVYSNLSDTPQTADDSDTTTVEGADLYRRVAQARGQERIEIMKESAIKENTIDVTDCRMSPRVIHVSSTRDVVFVNNGERFIYLSVLIPDVGQHLPYFVGSNNELTVKIASSLEQPDKPNPVSVACLFIEGDPPFVLEEIPPEKRQLKMGAYILVTPPEN